jgi:hypothetical protein
MEIAPEQQRAQELIASRLVVLKVSGRFCAVSDMRAEISAAGAKGPHVRTRLGRDKFQSASQLPHSFTHATQSNPGGPHAVLACRFQHS